MRSSTMSRKGGIRIWAAVCWLILWQAAAMIVGRDFLLASPLNTLMRFFSLASTAVFWKSALYSLARIMCGFLIGLTAGTLCAALAARFERVRELIAPLHTVLRAVPVASFVVAALIWMPSRHLSVLISALIVFPVVYATVLNEITHADRKLIEIAQVFRMPAWKKLIYVYFYPASERLESTVSTAVGLAWKSGIAAELISIPQGSIGEKLYKAKVYLMSGDLFAWTILIILLSAGCARLAEMLLHAFRRRLERI